MQFHSWQPTLLKASIDVSEKENEAKSQQAYIIKFRDAKIGSGFTLALPALCDAWNSSIWSKYTCLITHTAIKAIWH